MLPEIVKRSRWALINRNDMEDEKEKNRRISLSDVSGGSGAVHTFCGAAICRWRLYKLL